MIIRSPIAAFGPLRSSFSLINAAITALSDPTRQDMVAAVGELSATYPTDYFLRQMRDKMLVDGQGREILRRKPVISSAALNPDHLLTLPRNTLGHHYASFMIQEQISADTRSPIRYIQDEDLAYCMLRYRQIHDFAHTLTGLPTTLCGELALKCFEYYQTGLPMNLLAGLFGPVRLMPGALKFQDISSSSLKKYQSASEELSLFYSDMLPWAIHNGSRSKFLLNVMFEECLEMDLEELRAHLKIIPFDYKH